MSSRFAKLVLTLSASLLFVSNGVQAAHEVLVVSNAQHQRTAQPRGDNLAGPSAHFHTNPGQTHEATCQWPERAAQDATAQPTQPGSGARWRQRRRFPR